MKNVEATQTERSEELWTEREQQLAERFGVEPKLVRLLGEIAAENLDGVTGAVKGLAAEITGQPEAEPAPPSKGPEEPQVSDEALQFLDEYMREHMTTEERVTAYVLVRLALKDRAMADVIKDVLWQHVSFCFKRMNWHEQVEREDSREAVRDIQTVLNFWRRQTGTVEPEQEQPEAEVTTEQPQAEADAMTNVLAEVQKDRADIATRNQRKPEPITPTERLLTEWLLKQDFKAKLACSIMKVLLNGDHNHTDDLANELYSRFDDEVMAVAANPPESLGHDELLMTGVYSEMALWEARL
jgi:hypothetical protein